MQNILYSSSINYINTLLHVVSLASIVFGVYTIISKNPIISVLFLIGLFASISLYLILSGLQFIGLSYLIVYIGAISILFIFILMLINIRVSELLTETNNSIPLAILVILFFNLALNIVIPFNYIKNLTITLNSLYPDTSDYVINVASNRWESNLAYVSHISSIGNILYSVYFVLFILLSFILLLAMVGAISITINSPPKAHAFANAS